MKKLLFILFIFTLFSCKPDFVTSYAPDFDCPSLGYSAYYRINGCSMDEQVKWVNISEDEYSRLLGILQNSNEQCFLVTINPLDGSDPISGYFDLTGAGPPCAVG